jgi:hypothetical protein
MKKIKEISQGVAYLLVIQYYQFRYTFAYFSIIHVLAIIDEQARTELPFEYTWGERYLLWIEYLNRRSKGVKCTYKEVEFEYLKNFNDMVDEAIKKFHEERDKDDNWWWL